MPRLSIYSSDDQMLWAACNFNYSSHGWGFSRMNDRQVFGEVVQTTADYAHGRWRLGWRSWNGAKESLAVQASRLGMGGSDSRKSSCICS